MRLLHLLLKPDADVGADEHITLDLRYIASIKLVALKLTPDPAEELALRCHGTNFSLCLNLFSSLCFPTDFCQMAT